jgi:hypothetical protein
MRDRAMIVKLDAFGRNTADPIGAEARAVAMLLATSDFLQIARLPTELRPLLAQPLFAVVFGPELVSHLPEERTPSWGEYLVAAAREAPRLARDRSASGDRQRNASPRQAIGGGPVVHSERENLRSVTQATAAELQALGTKIPPGPLGSAIDRNVHYLTTFDVDSAISEGSDREQER